MLVLVSFPLLFVFISIYCCILNGLSKSHDGGFDDNSGDVNDDDNTDYDEVGDHCLIIVIILIMMKMMMTIIVIHLLLRSKWTVKVTRRHMMAASMIIVQW